MNKIILGISAIFVAGCAAFFSIRGIGLLFHGAFISVIVMATALEIAKIISASYLKKEWTNIGKLLKIYLTSAVIMLMLITSIGIFGFLSDAFQQQSIVIEQVERKISVINNQIKIKQQEIYRYSTNIKNLSNIRNSQEANISKQIERQQSIRMVSAMIKNADKEIINFSKKIDSLTASNIKLYQDIDNIKNENIDLEKQIGGFRFVAESFGVELKTAVKWFIILIVLVFDPLAIALILAFNQKKK